MNEKFRKELDIQLSDMKWTSANRRAVMQEIKRRRRAPARMAVVLAAALAVLMALAGIGYAEYHSGILSALFGGGQARREAEELMFFDPVSLEKDGITVSVTECLYDGQTLHMTAEMRNDTEEALLCGMKELHGSSGSGVFDLMRGLVMVQPGETVVGRAEVDDYAGLLQEVKIQAVALKPKGEVKPDVNDTEMYDVDTHYGTDRTETVFDETLSFQLPKSGASATKPGVKKIRVDEYGFTIVMKKANFAAASSRLEFEVIPDHQEDILSWGDEGSEGHGRLYRHYGVLDENGNQLVRAESFGLNWNKSRLTYSFNLRPLAEAPEQILLVPKNDDHEYLMDEAISVPIVPAK